MKLNVKAGEDAVRDPAVQSSVLAMVCCRMKLLFTLIAYNENIGQQK